MMSATCENKKVICDGKEIKDAIILCEGVKASAGVLLFDENLSPVYVPNAQPDLKELLDLMGQIADACSSITTTVQGAPTPINNVSDFASVKTKITQKQEELI